MLAGLCAGILSAGVPVSTAGVAFGAPPSEPSRVTVGAATAKTESFIVKGSGMAPSLEEAARSDLESLAKSSGSDVNDLTQKFRGKEEFDALAGRLLADADGGFVQGGYLDGARSGSGAAETWVRFTSRPSSEVISQLEKLPYVTQVQYGAPLAWSDLQNVAEAMFGATVRAEGTGEVLSEINTETDAIQISYQVSSGQTVDQDALIKQATTAGAAVSPTGDLPVPVTFARDDTLRSGAEATVKGGHYIDDATSYCTSGFTIKVGSTNGVATAMHCPNGLKYEGATGVIQYRNAASTTPTGNNIDLQWHSTLSGNSTSTLFRADAGEERNVDSASNSVVGDPACHYGEGTGYKRCSYVRSLGLCYTPEDLTFCGLASLQEYVSAGGDSGGPWFYGNQANGFHSGYDTIAGAPRSMFTPQTRVAENLSGSVKTS